MPKNEQPAVGRYIDPFVDFAFKRIFGNELNKDILIAFLNVLFRGRKCIVDLYFSKNEHPGELKGEGAAIFDIFCSTDNGERLIIEVQRGLQANFKERTLFYTSRLISDQAPKGKRSKWKYNLTEVYLIALLENSSADISAEQNYLHDICLCNRDTGEVFYNKLGFIYVEFDKFVKKDTELETNLDKWLHALKNMKWMTGIPSNLDDPIFEKLFSVGEYHNLNKEEKNMYDNSLKIKWDNESVLDYAINTTKKNNTLEIARNLKKAGSTNEFIAMITNLSIEEIEKL